MCSQPQSVDVEAGEADGCSLEPCYPAPLLPCPLAILPDWSFNNCSIALSLRTKCSIPPSPEFTTTQLLFPGTEGLRLSLFDRSTNENEMPSSRGAIRPVIACLDRTLSSITQNCGELDERQERKYRKLVVRLVHQIEPGSERQQSKYQSYTRKRARELVQAISGTMGSVVLFLVTQKVSETKLAFLDREDTIAALSDWIKGVSIPPNLEQNIARIHRQYGLHFCTSNSMCYDPVRQ